MDLEENEVVSVSGYMYALYKVKNLKKRIEMVKRHRNETLNDLNELKVEFISLWEQILDANGVSEDPEQPPLTVLCSALKNIGDSLAYINSQ